MSYASQLRQKAQVLKRVSGTDPYGQPRDEWAADPNQAKVPCRVDPIMGTKIYTNRRGQEVRATHTVFFLSSVDLVEDDRLNIPGPGGALDLDILLVGRPTDGVGRVHHVEVDALLFRGTTREAQARSEATAEALT